MRIDRIRGLALGLTIGIAASAAIPSAAQEAAPSQAVRTVACVPVPE